MQILKEENYGQVTVSGNQLTLAPSRLNFGGQQRTTPELSALNTNLDTGTVQASKLYYIYAVYDGTFDLVMSLSDQSPSGYNRYRKVGAFETDASTDVLNVFPFQLTVAGKENGFLNISQNGSNLTNQAGEIRFDLGTASILEGNTPVSTEDDSANNRTKFVASREVSVTVSFTYYTSNTNHQAKIFHYDLSGTLLATYAGTQDDSAETAVNNSSFKMSVGDFFTAEADTAVRNTANNTIVNVATKKDLQINWKHY